MNEEDIRRILLAPVSEVRQATDKEAEAFADKPDGCLYVLGTKNNHQFLTHISKKAKEYTLRPMGDFLPNLKEIRWKDAERVASHGVETQIKCADGTSISERDAYARALVPHLDPQYSTDSMWMFHFQYNPLYKRARDIRIVQAERFVMPDKKISCAQIKLARQGRV
jgi:hypothetical protein